METFYIDGIEYLRFDYIFGIGKIAPNEYPIIIPVNEPAIYENESIKSK